jgi:hypothetical protein
MALKYPPKKYAPQKTTLKNLKNHPQVGFLFFLKSPSALFRNLQFFSLKGH